MSTHWNGTIAHASSVTSSAVQNGTFAPMRVDDLLVFGKGQRGHGQGDAQQGNRTEEPDQGQRHDAEDDAAQNASHA